jgi:hypothetical protein
MLIKKNIKYTGNNVNIQIPLSTNNEFSGYQQEIEEYTNIKSADSINDATDGEVFKFKLDDNDITKFLSIKFYSFNDQIWQPNYIYAGFTLNEIPTDLKFLNSFFIFDFFDSYEPANQTKLFSTYLTNLNLFNVDDGLLPSSKYKFDPQFQLYNQYIPIDYLNIDSNIDKYTGYTRISFYNAKSGNTVVFYNEDNENIATAEKLHFKTEIDLVNKTWKFLTPSFLDNDILYAKELVNSNNYLERYNNTFENFNNLQQNYPDGNTFNFETGEYETTN